jgi:hypothetical protein
MTASAAFWPPCSLPRFTRGELIDDTQVIHILSKANLGFQSVFRLKHNLVAVELIQYFVRCWLSISSNYKNTTRSPFPQFLLDTSRKVHAHDLRRAAASTSLKMQRRHEDSEPVALMGKQKPPVNQLIISLFFAKISSLPNFLSEVYPRSIVALQGTAARLCEEARQPQ